jgi:hypothetical protein
MHLTPLTFNSSSFQLYQLFERRFHVVLYLDRETPRTPKNNIFTIPTAIIKSPQSHEVPSDLLTNNDTDLYIKISSKYYPLLFVSDSITDFNTFLKANPDTGLIATDNKGFHYIAQLQPANK